MGWREFFLQSKRKLIGIVGMPGSGKSTIGKRLSGIMKLHFFDCDDYIERMEGKRLQQIINENGVKEFKKLKKPEYWS